MWFAHVLNAFFSLTHNHGGPSPQGGLIQEKKIQQLNELKRKRKRSIGTRSEVLLDRDCVDNLLFFPCFLKGEGGPPRDLKNNKNRILNITWIINTNDALPDLKKGLV